VLRNVRKSCVISSPSSTLDVSISMATDKVPGADSRRDILKVIGGNNRPNIYITLINKMDR
jgi:hypothetical protein